MRILGRLAVLVIVIGALAASILWLLYGGGERFPDRSTEPLLSADRVEVVATLAEPPGNIAVSAEGRVFLTIHPEAKPDVRVAELVNSELKPFPDAASQKELFHSPQGIRIDRQNRLWTIDHGNHSQKSPRLLAFDLASGKEVHRFDFDSDLSPVLSYLQDLVVSPDGKTVYIADASIFRRNPAIIVYDVTTRTGRRVLAGESSVKPQNFLIQTYRGPATRLGGLLALKVGVDSIGLDSIGEWLYYGAMNHGDLFRVKTTHLLNASTAQVASLTQKYSDKVISDGITLDAAGTVYLTDVEHSAVAVVTPARELKTLVKHPKMRWPDGFSFGPDGYLYLADSAIPDIVMRSRASILQAGPYHVFRIRTGATAVPGQ